MINASNIIMASHSMNRWTRAEWSFRERQELKAAFVTERGAAAMSRKKENNKPDNDLQADDFVRSQAYKHAKLWSTWHFCKQLSSSYLSFPHTVPATNSIHLQHLLPKHLYYSLPLYNFPVLVKCQVCHACACNIPTMSYWCPTQRLIL